MNGYPLFTPLITIICLLAELADVNCTEGNPATVNSTMNMSCAVAVHSTEKPSDGEKSLSPAATLAELYAFTTGKMTEDEDTEAFVKMHEGLIHCDRVRIKEDSVVIIAKPGSSMPASVELSHDDFKMVMCIMCMGWERTFELKIRNSNYNIAYVLKLLSAATNLLVHPYLAVRDMRPFLWALITMLDRSEARGLDSIEKPEDMEGVTGCSLRTILDIYAGMDDFLMYVPYSEYTTDRVGDPLTIYMKYEYLECEHQHCLLLNLIRLCRITELNLYWYKMDYQLSKRAQDILARCGITRVVPPYWEKSCKNFFLTADSNEDIVDRIWPHLTEIGWFNTKGDVVNLRSFCRTLKTPKLTFCKNIVRPKVQPEDFSTIEFVIIEKHFPSKMANFLEQATNLRMFRAESCFNSFPLNFLKHMSKLEVLHLEDTHVVELPAEIRRCLPGSTALHVSPHSTLEKLPAALLPVFVRLRCLAKLFQERFW